MLDTERYTIALCRVISALQYPPHEVNGYFFVFSVIKSVS